ncbi:MAG TPA: FAD-binding oxidoreductase [Pyrinomonadaceae bacterium]|nr:FAD-binding oxidoreductase [Pyrinomonadaceae bacterium]
MSRTVSMEIHGWGRYPRGRSRVLRPERVREAVPPDEGSVIARGQGRSYGDAAMSADGAVMLTERLNRFLSFDEETGVLRAEAGATLAEVLAVFLPRGWFPPVTPGTKFVSLGGALAADVHGKNHHRDGTLGAHVTELELALADGTRRRCSPERDAELFWATVGGMGLTGIITEVSLKLARVESAHVVVRHNAARDLDALLELLADEEHDERYSVAWVDSLARGRALGRGVLMTGRHASLAALPRDIAEPLALKSPRRLGLPFDLPSWVLNPLSVSAFNELYFRRQGARDVPFVTDCESFFYPLDRVGDWNRLYGARGFVQYQCVLPPATARGALRLLFEELSRTRRASFLAVLKRFGAEGRGLLSFPFEGYTLALDLPVTGADLFALLDRFDELVLEHGGRVYLAKDTRLKPDSFRAMYPRFTEWLRVKQRFDPEDRFSSDLSRRLGMGARA